MYLFLLVLICTSARICACPCMSAHICSLSPHLHFQQLSLVTPCLPVAVSKPSDLTQGWNLPWTYHLESCLPDNPPFTCSSSISQSNCRVMRSVCSIWVELLRNSGGVYKRRIQISERQNISCPYCQRLWRNQGKRKLKNMNSDESAENSHCWMLLPPPKQHFSLEKAWRSLNWGHPEFPDLLSQRMTLYAVLQTQPW